MARKGQKGALVAYQSGKTGALQTAVNAAATITAAYIGATEDPNQVKDLVDINGVFEGIKAGLFAELSAQVDADNALFKAEAESAPKATGGSSRRAGSTGGTGAGAAPNGAITLEKAKDLVLNFGAFKGMTLQEVWEASASEAADRGYGEGDKTGKKYVTWLTGNERNAYVASHAQVLVDANK